MKQPQQTILADQLKTVNQVPNANGTIRFMIDRNEITYTVDMFCSTLKLPVEAPNHPFIASATLKRCLRSSTDVLLQEHQRLEEEYHSIKDDILLVSVYTTRDVTVKGMLTPEELFTDNIHESHKYTDYAKEFVRVDVPTIHIQLVESTQGANRTPRATRTPNPKDVTIKQKKHVSTAPPPPSDDRKRDDIVKATLLSLTLLKTAKIAEEQENVAKVHEKILEEDIKKIVKGEYEEFYAGEFTDSIFLDEEDSGTRLEPESHKENLKIVDDDDVEKKKDDKKDDDDDDEDNDDHDDHALVKNKVISSLEDRNEKIQTPIPSPPRSPRTDLSSDKTISQELTATISPTPATTLKIKANLTIAKTNALMKEAILKMINDAVKQNRELSTDIVPELDILKKKFEKSSVSTILCKSHDAHQGDDGPLNGRKGKKIEDIKRVLKEVKLKIFETEFLKKAPLLGGLDLDMMKTTPRATRIPNPVDYVVQNQKGKRADGEITLHKPSLKEQENMAVVKKKILEEDVEKIEGEDEESYASEFAYFVFLDEEYSGTRNRVTGSLETRIEKMQTPIPSPSRSLMKQLSSDKDTT
nr:hypothetical protein [Tanacetum cinerariifolium]